MSPKKKPVTETTPEDAARMARGAGLRYVSDDQPGIARQASGKTFRYFDARGHVIRDADEVTRLRKLAIPPAWTKVWICPNPLGHIQATGRDARGRKQYRYHPHWREVRDEAKFDRMMAFAAALPKVRIKAEQDLALPGMPREKVLATVVQLLELTLIRIGNEEYARQNESFGLTTLRERHVEVHGRHLHFQFRGKSGKDHSIDVSDPRLAAIVKRCQDLPGQELFHFKDENGALHPIESSDVNAYLHEAAGDHFTAKDFRTWHGTLLAARALSQVAEVATDKRPSKRAVAEVFTQVAARLGNTPTVCRKSYVHPAVVNRYLRGEGSLKARGKMDLPKLEVALLAVLKKEATRAETSLTGALKSSLRVVSQRNNGAGRRAAPGLSVLAGRHEKSAEWLRKRRADRDR